jgi:putative spermidine/putrescine transport system permease protein
MGGGQINTAVGAITTELNAFQYPPAAAKSVVMLVIVLTFVVALLRLVDIRKELAN